MLYFEVHVHVQVQVQVTFAGLQLKMHACITTLSTGARLTASVNKSS